MKVTISKADILGPHAKPGDESKTWDLDLEGYHTMLMDAIEKTAFQRRVRYLKATQAVDAAVQP